MDSQMRKQNAEQAAQCSGVPTARERADALAALTQNPTEENLWNCVVAFRGSTFRTMSGLEFSYQMKQGRRGGFTKELWIDRRESSKSLAWSSVRLAFRHIARIGDVVDRPKALGDIRGVSYIYGMFYRFGLIDVPLGAREKMNKAAEETADSIV